MGNPSSQDLSLCSRIGHFSLTRVGMVSGGLGGGGGGGGGLETSEGAGGPGGCVCQGTLGHWGSGCGGWWDLEAVGQEVTGSS